MRRTRLLVKDIAEVKRVFIKAGLDIVEIKWALSQEGEPIEYEVMRVTVSGDSDKMANFKQGQLKEFREQHQMDMGVEYLCGSTYKRKSTCTFEFWKY